MFFNFFFFFHSLICFLLYSISFSVSNMMTQTLSYTLESHQIKSLTHHDTNPYTCHLTLSFLLPKRFLSFKTITHPPLIPSLCFSLYLLSPLSYAFICLPLVPTCFTSIQCRINRSENPIYSLLNFELNFSNQLSIEMITLFYIYFN